MSLEDRQNAMRRRSQRKKHGVSAKLRQKIIRTATRYPFMPWKLVASDVTDYGKYEGISAQYVQQVMSEAGYYKRRVTLKDKEGKEYQAWETVRMEKI